MARSELSPERVRELALGSGYDLAGFAPLKLEPADLDNLERFALEGYAAGMSWFGEHLELRKQPAELFPGAKSALVLGVYYRDPAVEAELTRATFRVSRYAGGRDYHRLLRKKGKRLLAALKEIDAQIQGRIVVDSAPVPEKILARMAGLGWQGKHTNLIHPELGSYFFLSVLLLNREFALDEALPDLCGDCTLCLEACPTGALFEAYRIDAGRCISYLTIERDEGLPIAKALESAATGSDRGAHSARNQKEDFENWVFGCDICQEVCPYNRNRRSRDRGTRETAFQLREAVRDFMRFDSGDSENFDWAALLSGSPLGRAGEAKLRQNMEYVRNAAKEER